MVKKTTETSWGKMSKTETLIHRQTILIENLESNFKFVIEKVDGMEERINRRADERFAQQDERFDRIEAVLRVHSQLLNQNEERWKQNEKRWVENGERWAKNDNCLERIETKLDTVIEKVERHDVEIKEIKRHMVSR